MTDWSPVSNTRIIALTAGVLSLALGLWGLFAEEPALAVAAGAVGFVAGLLSAVPSIAPMDSLSAKSPLAKSSSGETIISVSDTIENPARSRQDEAHPSKALGDSTPPIASPGAALLNDPESGLLSEAYLRVALESRLASARRHLRPVALALMATTEGADGDGEAVRHMTESLQETIREADIACRMDNGIFALILEDTPENGAVWTVERVRRNLVSHFGHHTLWAGVSCYPAHALEADELLTQSQIALLAAKEWNQDRIEVAASE